MKEMHVEITFEMPVLGSLPADESAFRDFIAVKAPEPALDDLEVEADALRLSTMAEDTEPRGLTIFPKLDNGRPFLYDYQIKGFFKAAAATLRRIPVGPDSGNIATAKIRAYKKIIDTLVFVYDREIPLEFDGEIALKSRSLRAMTMQGERISIATSEMVPAGTKCRFTVRCLDGSHMDAVKEWLDYGIYNGIGCWRNSGMGRFAWKEV